MNILRKCFPCIYYDYEYIEIPLQKKPKIKLELIDVKECSNFFTEIKENSEPNSLYLFPEHLYEYHTSIPGNGQSIIRQFNKNGFEFYKYPKPRSLGLIVSSYYCGYTSLTPDLKKTLDANIKEIFYLHQKYTYTKIKIIMKDNYIHTGTLFVSKDILQYIIDRIEQLIKQINNYRFIV